jgi:hypothetical protein
MDAIIKEKFVKALESDEYKQGTVYLRSISNCFCVLGVLCDLYVKENNTSWGEDDGDKFYLLNASSALPREVTKWAGLPLTSISRSAEFDDIKIIANEDPIYSSLFDDIKTITNEDPLYLSELNDTGISFKELARIIREQL